MRSRRLGAAFAALALVLAAEPVAAELVLERVVLVSRHGVRSPTDPAALTAWSSRAWPDWPVPPGNLTPRGAQLATLMGGYYRAFYASHGLIAGTGCPKPDEVHLYADVDQRTRATGEALLAGMFPGCGLAVRHAPVDKPDPLFHPARGGVCEIDGEHARAAIFARAQGSLYTALEPEREPLRRLQQVLDCCAPKLCEASGAEGRCTLATLPSGIDLRHNDGVRLTGPISIGSTASEVFLLQYAEGLPQGQVGWGRASTPAQINALLRLHRLQFDLLQRTPYLAARQGSMLLRRVLETLRQTAEGAGDTDAPAGAKLVVYVGHDTNLANLGGMLGVSWQLPGYGPDATPPAGSLAFELLRETATGQRYVRMVYRSQTLDQMRRMTPLGRRSQPSFAPIALRGCVEPAAGGACPWPDFDARAKSKLDPECVAPKPQ